MNQVKPSEQVVGRIAMVLLSGLVARALRATLVTALTQARCHAADRLGPAGFNSRLVGGLPPPREGGREDTR